MSELISVSINTDGEFINTEWYDGSFIRFHAIWLRDNAQDAATRSTENGQRLITLQEIPGETLIDKASVEQSCLQVHFQPEGKWISFDENWLLTNAYDRPVYRDPGWLNDNITCWRDNLDLGSVTRSYESVMTSPAALMNWLEAIAEFGIARLSDGPSLSGALLDVIKLFGFVRETNYGRWFDVRSEVKPENLAFSSAGLQAHSDNPYRDPVPTLQLLYCLENSAKGGDSLVVDGFAAALRLRQENPDHFALLSKYCARFSYKGAGDAELTARKPIIELAPDGEMIGVRFNNRSASAFTDIPFEVLPEYYRAYRRLGEIIECEDMAVTFKLEPGECFIVDNTRVLHGRTGFATGEGSRWLQGCYADKDGLLSRLTELRSTGA